MQHSEMSEPPWAASNPLLHTYRIKASLTLWVKGYNGITVSGILLDQKFCAAKAWPEDIRLLFVETKKSGSKSHKNLKLHDKCIK